MGIAIGSNVGSLARQTSLNQAVRNAGDLVDIARIADLALTNTTEILSRIRELTIQAGSGTLDTTARGDVQNEIAVLQAELDRLASSTELNGAPLLRARGAQTYQVGSRNVPTSDPLTLTTADATESSNLSRGIILSHATASVLVQANQHPQAALRLLA